MMPRWLGPAARLAVGGGVLVAIIARVGTGPFVHGLLSLNASAIGAATVLVWVATAAAAWRWRLIAGRLGLALPWHAALGMYYRSQFLNSVLPGGVIGDVERAVVHGRRAGTASGGSAESRTEGAAGTAARAVAVERVAGQVVQLAFAGVLVIALGTAFTGVVLPAAGIVLASACGVIAVAAISAKASARVRRALRHEARELRIALGSAAISARVVVASVVVVCCHIAVFAIASAAVGADVPPAQLLTLAVIVLLAASLPLNIGGWGPREGVAGWAFAMAGLGASAGVSAATLYGILAVLAIAPGAIVGRLASLNVWRTHRERPSLRDRQLRHLPRRIPRHLPAAETRALEPGGLRPGG